ncbi:hypothetical protein K1W54_12535 [Micromonospora sp. CPCC 205371]|nr:hypothetical protein [Micromonospora sp. CPCC 205371]
MTDNPPTPDTPNTTNTALDAAIGHGAHAVADRHHINIPPELREDLARTVLGAAWPHLNPTTSEGNPQTT